MTHTLFIAAGQVTVPMAVEDYLPLILAALGWTYVARMLARQTSGWGGLAWLGLLLVTLGGLFKATWKLLYAANGMDIPLLNNGLFILLAPGFVCLAWALWRSDNRRPRAAQAWAVPLILCAIVLGAAAYLGLVKGGRGWFGLLLGVTSLGNLAAGVWLIRRSRHWSLPLAAALFLLNLVAVFALTRMSDQTMTLQWIKQGINTLSQLAFMLAARQLQQRSLRYP